MLCKILCHNLCCLIQSSYELGIDAAFGNEGQSCPSHLELAGYSLVMILAKPASLQSTLYLQAT